MSVACSYFFGRFASVGASGFGITDGELLAENEKALEKRVPLRFVKRPYLKADDRSLKSRANRKRWEERREQRTVAWGASEEAQVKRAAKAEAQVDICPLVIPALTLYLPRQPMPS